MEQAGKEKHFVLQHFSLKCTNQMKFFHTLQKSLWLILEF